MRWAKARIFTVVRRPEKSSREAGGVKRRLLNIYGEALFDVLIVGLYLCMISITSGAEDLKHRSINSKITIIFLFSSIQCNFMSILQLLSVYCGVYSIIECTSLSVLYLVYSIQYTLLSVHQLLYST